MPLDSEVDDIMCLVENGSTVIHNDMHFQESGGNLCVTNSLNTQLSFQLLKRK